RCYLVVPLPLQIPRPPPLVCRCTNSRPGHPHRTVTETVQVADEPHAQPWQRGRIAGAATSPGFFPARRATCEQTALKKVGSKREAGQRPPRVTQPHLWSKKERTWTWTEKSARRWSSTGLPPLRAIIAAFVLNCCANRSRPRLKRRCTVATEVPTTEAVSA